MPKRTIMGEGKRLPLNMRTTAALRKKIERAAGQSGRSLVQEVEHRMEQSFHRDELAEIRDELTLIATVLGAVVRDPRLSIATGADERAILDRVARNGGEHG